MQKKLAALIWSATDDIGDNKLGAIRPQQFLKARQVLKTTAEQIARAGA